MNDYKTIYDAVNNSKGSGGGGDGLFIVKGTIGSPEGGSAPFIPDEGEPDFETALAAFTEDGKTICLATPYSDDNDRDARYIITYVSSGTMITLDGINDCVVYWEPSSEEPDPEVVAN